MKTEYLEPYLKTYPTKAELITAWSDWLESKKNDWDLFAVTIVFNAGGKIPRSDRWENEYKENALKKIKKVIERNKKNHDIAIPYEHFCYYEFDESSIFRITSSRKPHHIHALIPIRKSSTYRFWSTDAADIQPRLKKDLFSIDSIGSILVEPLKDGASRDWVSYCVKGRPNL